MTAIQMNAMNAEVWRNIGAIADNEELMRRLARYTRRLVQEQQSDPTLMTKEEYFAKLERAERQADRGEGMLMLSGEDLTHFLIRNGYEI